MEPVRCEIAPEVCLNYVRSDKFKTGTLSLQLITPLSEETASFGALLPSVLRRGTMEHPDMRSLSTALDLLYGSSIGCTVRKKGENPGLPSVDCSETPDEFTFIRFST